MANFFEQFHTDEAAAAPPAAPVAAPDAQAGNFFAQFHPAEEQKGFIGRVADDFAKRGNQVQNIGMMADKTGQNGILTTAEQVATGGFGTMNDVASEAIKSIPGAQYVMGKIGQGVAALPLNDGTNVGQRLQQASGAIDQMRAQHPQIAAGADAIGNTVGALSTFVPGAKAVEAVAPAAIDGAKAVGKSVLPVIADAAKGELPGAVEALRTAPVTSDMIRAEAGKAYDFARQKGGVLGPQSRNEFLDTVNGLHPEGTEVPVDPAYKKVVDVLNLKRDQPLTLEGAQEIDKYLGAQINKNVLPTGKLDEAGKQIADIQNALREHTFNPDPAHFEGGNDGFQAWQEGNRLWQKQAQARDIENIFRRAETAINPQTAISNGFASLARNDKRLRGYDQETRAAILDAAKTGVVPDFLKTMGSRLLPVIGAGVHGPLGAITGEAVSVAARKAGTAAQMAKANKVAKMIGKDYQFQAPAEAPAKMLALPAPQNDIAVASNGTASAVDASEMTRANLLRQEYASKGLTPDVLANINRNNIRQTFGPAFDALEKSSQDKIAAQVDQMWQANPKASVQDLITSADQMAQMLATETGDKAPQGAMAEALRNAKRIK